MSTQDRFYYYLVEGVSATDKANSVNAGAVHGYKDDGQGGQIHYDVLKYDAPYTFDGTETSAVQLTHKEARNASLSPVFKDYASMPFNTVWGLATELVDLQLDACRMIMDFFAAIYMQDYDNWSDADRILYIKQLYDLGLPMAIGSLPIMKYELSLFVDVTNPDYKAPQAPLTAQMCLDAMGMIDLFMSKAPR